MIRRSRRRSFFFFNDTATTEIYTLSLHDALPISSPPHRCPSRPCRRPDGGRGRAGRGRDPSRGRGRCRSEEHTSELQSQSNLVCRLLLEKKKKEREHASYSAVRPVRASVKRLLRH